MVLLQGSVLIVVLGLLIALAVSAHFVFRTGYRLYRRLDGSAHAGENVWMLWLDFVLSCAVALVAWSAARRM